MHCFERIYLTVAQRPHGNHPIDLQSPASENGADGFKNGLKYKAKTVMSINNSPDGNEVINSHYRRRNKV